MKKTKLLFIATAVLALSGCTIGDVDVPDNIFGGDTGVVTDAKTQKNVRRLYENSVDNTEDLETIEDDGTETEEDPVVEDGSETSEEEPSESEETSEDEGEEETDIDDVVTSYHVDYTYEYALKASMADYVLIDQSETESYSLTYVKDGDDLFLDMSMTHSYKENDFYSGSEEVRAIFQDGVLYVTTSIQNGGFWSYESKDAYDIFGSRIYKEFNDYFRYTYLDMLFVDGSKDDSYSLLDTLLTAEDVTITDVDDSTVTIAFKYDDSDATIKFDTELQTILSATFDDSANFLASLEIPEDSPITVDVATSKVTANFSYNDQTADKLSEEEIAEYNTMFVHHGHDDYGHENDHSHYGDDHGRGDNNHDHDGWDEGNDWDDWGDWGEGSGDEGGTDEGSDWFGRW